MSFRVGAEELQLRRLRVGIVNGGGDLCRRQLAPGPKLRRFQLGNHLPFVKTIAFLREDFLDPAARTRSDVRLVHFDRA